MTKEVWEPELTIDEQLASLRARVGVVVKWYENHQESLVPPLTVRADMVSIAVAFRQLDVWLSEGGPLPSAWTENRGNPEYRGRWLRPELVARKDLIPASIVEAFVALQTPVSVPLDMSMGRELLSAWLHEHARPLEGERLVWEIQIVDNGAYVVRTDERGVIRAITYEAR